MCVLTVFVRYMTSGVIEIKPSCLKCVAYQLYLCVSGVRSDGCVHYKTFRIVTNDPEAVELFAPYMNQGIL